VIFPARGTAHGGSRSGHVLIVIFASFSCVCENAAAFNVSHDLFSCPEGLSAALKSREKFV